MPQRRSARRTRRTPERAEGAVVVVMSFFIIISSCRFRRTAGLCPGPHFLLLTQQKVGKEKGAPAVQVGMPTPLAPSAPAAAAETRSARTVGDLSPPEPYSLGCTEGGSPPPRPSPAGGRRKDAAKNSEAEAGGRAAVSCLSPRKRLLSEPGQRNAGTALRARYLRQVGATRSRARGGVAELCRTSKRRGRYRDGGNSSAVTLSAAGTTVPAPTPSRARRIPSAPPPR